MSHNFVSFFIKNNTRITATEAKTENQLNFYGAIYARQEIDVFAYFGIGCQME